MFRGGLGLALAWQVFFFPSETAFSSLVRKEVCCGEKAIKISAVYKMETLF